MYQHFDKTFFTGNRDRLQKLCTDDAPIVITANALLQKSMDIEMPFHQDGNFWYLTGLNEPSAVLVIDAEQTYLIMPAQSDYLKYFYGQAGGDDVLAISGITRLYEHEEGWQQLTSSLKKAKKVYTLTAPEEFSKVYGFFTNPARRVLIEGLNEAVPKLTIDDIRQQLARLRMVKQSAELKALQAAVDLTVEAFTAAQQKTFTSEKELEAAFTIHFLNHGLHDHAYEPIVAHGGRACQMHQNKNLGKIKNGQLTLIDIGVEVDSYTADITRMFSHGKVTKRQREVYDAVLRVQEFAIEGIRPGISLRENEKRVEVFMGEEMIKLGLIEKADRESIRHYFPHATSHFLGRDIHDLGDYDAPLAENIVLTVEPGIYIPEEGIGVRIEDDILVTKNGCKIMSAALPRTLK